MKLYRAITIILLTIQLVGLCAFAALTPFLKATTPQGKPGDTVSVTLSITNAQALGSFDIDMLYDTQKVEYVAFVSNGSFTTAVNPNTVGRLLLSGLSVKGAINTSVQIGTVSFKIKPNTQGVAVLTFKKTLGGNYNDFSQINIQADSGTIIIDGILITPTPITVTELTPSPIVTITPIPTITPLPTDLPTPTITISPSPTDTPLVTIPLSPTPVITATPSPEPTIATLPSAENQRSGGSSLPNTKNAANVTPSNMVKPNFEDITKYKWANESITELSSNGIIKGQSDKSFAPQEQIKRADYIVLMVRMLGLTAQVTDNFTDVTADKYYYRQIGIVKALGLAAGIGHNEFSPEEPITRQDMIVLTYRMLKKLNKINPQGNKSSISQYLDIADIASYAKEEFAAFLQLGFIKGTDSRLNPQSKATRAETAVFVYRIYKNIK